MTPKLSYFPYGNPPRVFKDQNIEIRLEPDFKLEFLKDCMHCETALGPSVKKTRKTCLSVVHVLRSPVAHEFHYYMSMDSII